MKKTRVGMGMMIGILLLLTPLLVSAGVNGVKKSDACVTPEDELSIETNITLCPGKYRVSGFRIEADNLTLDCNGAELEGDLRRIGITLTRNQNVIIKNCGLAGYRKAIAINGGSRIKITNTTLSYNVVGLHTSGSTLIDSSGVTFVDNENNGINQPVVAEEKPRGETIQARFDNQPSEKVIDLFRLEEQNQSLVLDKISVEKYLTIEDNTRSVITVVLTPLTDIDNLVMYEHVPKNIADNASKIEFDKSAIVIREDPDFMIPIGRVTVKSKITVKYKIGKKVNIFQELPVTLVASQPQEEPEPLPVPEVMEEEEAGSFFSRGLLQIGLLFLIVLVSYVLYRFEKRYI